MAISFNNTRATS